MKAKIVYTLVYLIAFALTTLAMIFLNNKYQNIFKFDFSPAVNAQQVPGEKGNNKSKGKSEAEEKNEDGKDLAQEGEGSKADSAKVEGVKAGDQKTSKGAQSDAKLQEQKAGSVNNTSANKEQAPNSAALKAENRTKEESSFKAAEKTSQDSAYVKWKKAMVKTYEKMDPRSVAKILMNMNDNYARDILFALKDKKRAQIIETILNISPEAASRLTRTP